jgi:hypothetical protein
MANYSQLFEKKSEREQLPEKWAELLAFLRDSGFMAEITTQLQIRPIVKENSAEQPFSAKKLIIRNMITRQSMTLSKKLRDEYSLPEITDERVDLSLLDGSLSKYSDEKDAV